MIIIDKREQKTRRQMVSDLAAGVPFRSSRDGVRWSSSIFVKVKVTGFLLNSAVISDVLNRGDSLVHNVTHDTLHAIKGDTYVRQYVGTFVVTDEVD